MPHPMTIALFGEAEKGQFHTAYYVENLNQLADAFGHPPEETKGLHFAVQSLLYGHEIIFFRVKEEGFSRDDYLMGLNFLGNRELVPYLNALALPGLGDAHIIQASEPVCDVHHSLLLTSEDDLYDYLTFTVR